ncbi:MAG: histidine kinase dimerization/phosphoacceptor domain -containing protein [Spirosomataceae bacterium]
MRFRCSILFQKAYKAISGAVSLSFFSISLCLYAQQKEDSPQAIGQRLYERLEETKKDYEGAMKKGDSSEVAEMCYRLGKRYSGLGDFQTAQRWFIRSLNIRERLGDSEAEGIGKVYIFMTQYLMQQKQYQPAYSNLSKAIMNFKKADASVGLTAGYLAMANLQDAASRPPQKYPEFSLDSALYYYRLAETLALQLNRSFDVANINFCKGVCLVHARQTSGMDYLKQSQALFLKQEKPTYGVLNTMIHLGEACLIFQKNEEAKEWLDKARYMMDTSRFGDHAQKSKLLLTYADLYEKSGQWQQAFETQKQYYTLMMDALNADREGAVTRLSLAYESKKKEDQLRQQQRQIRIVMAAGLLAILTSIIFYQFFQKYKHLSEQNKELVAEQNHRVKNNLQRVTNLLSLQLKPLQDEEAKKAITEALLRIEAIAAVHRRLYDSDRLTEVEMSTFIPELMEGVLQSCNYPSLHPHYTLESVWLHVDQAIPLGLILNELVTNSCKYAFPFSAAPALTVNCRLEKNRIRLETVDNGPGFDVLQQHKSYGLKLIQVFTDQLKGTGGFEEGGRKFQLEFTKQNHSIKDRKKIQSKN